MQNECSHRENEVANVNLQEATLVSFDIPEKDGSCRLRIHRYLHGRRDTKDVNGEIRTYRYPGILCEGGFRVGQSVYLLPRDLASRLIKKLVNLNVRHRYWDVILEGRGL